MACVSSPVTGVMLLCTVDWEEKFLIPGNMNRIFVCPLCPLKLPSPSRRRRKLFYKYNFKKNSHPRICLLIGEREGKGEREWGGREREKHWLVSSQTHPDWGSSWSPRYGLTGNPNHNLLVYRSTLPGRRSNQLNHPAWAINTTLKRVHYVFNKWLTFQFPFLWTTLTGYSFQGSLNKALHL